MTQQSHHKQASMIVAEAYAMRRRPDSNDVVQRIATELKCSTSQAKDSFTQITSKAYLPVV